jgi:hypothetical protein
LKYKNNGGGVGPVFAYNHGRLEAEGYWHQYSRVKRKSRSHEEPQARADLKDRPSTHPPAKSMGLRRDKFSQNVDFRTEPLTWSIPRNDNTRHWAGFRCRVTPKLFLGPLSIWLSPRSYAGLHSWSQSQHVC